MSGSKWVSHQVHRVKVWIWVWYCSNQKVKWVTVSNFLGRSPDPRSIGSISSMIGQAKVIMIYKKKASHIESITHINTRYVKHTHEKNATYSNKISYH